MSTQKKTAELGGAVGGLEGVARNSLLDDYSTDVDDGKTHDQLKTTQLCSGFGQFHTDKPDPEKRRKHKPYVSITFEQIRAMMANPPKVAKDDSQWVIFSDTHTREANKLREGALYYAVWADIDEPGASDFDDIFSRACSALPGTAVDAYTSCSAKPTKHKSRITAELADPLEHDIWVIAQKIFNDKLQDAGINVDRVTEVSNQLCYLPNRGEFYAYKSAPGDLLDAGGGWYSEINDEANRRKAIDNAARQAKQERIQRDPPSVPPGGVVPSQYLMQNYSAKTMLEENGAVFVSSTRFYSPNRKRDGTPGGIYDPATDKFFIHHENDPFHDGHRHGVIDLLMESYSLDWSQESSFVELCRRVEVSPGVSIELHNQRAHMAAKGDQDTMDSFDDIGGNDENEPEDDFDLSKYSLSGSSAKMREKMLDDKFILGRMAILGQSTVFYAKPNAGKTLLTIWLIVHSIKAGEISGEDVFYINADDNHKGLTYKLELAEKYGFHMLAPGYNGFEAGDFSKYLRKLTSQDKARGKVLILDTVKKFTDVMDKKVGSAFGESVRRFVSHGGSVIMLAHVNKHRDADNKVIFSGTSDIVDDADCAYTLDTVTEDSFKTRTVKFENFKSRGDAASEEVYKYCAADGTMYGDRLESVTMVSDDERKQAEHTARRNQQLELNGEAIDAIKDCIREGITKKTELIAAASERAGLSKPKISRALKAHAGGSVADHEFWHVTIGDKNAHHYALNYLV